MTDDLREAVAREEQDSSQSHPVFAPKSAITNTVNTEGEG